MRWRNSVVPFGLGAIRNSWFLGALGCRVPNCWNVCSICCNCRGLWDTCWASCWRTSPSESSCDRRVGWSRRVCSVIRCCDRSRWRSVGRNKPGAHRPACHCRWLAARCNAWAQNSACVTSRSNPDASPAATTSGLWGTQRLWKLVTLGLSARIVATEHFVCALFCVARSAIRKRTARVKAFLTANWG